MTPQDAFDIINASGTHRCIDCREWSDPWSNASHWAIYRPEDRDWKTETDFLTDEEVIAFAKGLEARNLSEVE